MTASPVGIPASPTPPASIIWRRPLALSARRLAANRHNASRSTGPRTAKGKARVARNAIKHGFFASADRWTERQHRDFAKLMAGLREDFHPQDAHEDHCVATIAASYVRIAALWRYESIAALEYHRQQERELNARIATAEPAEAEALEAHLRELRHAGLWRPTIPGPREAAAILRYEGKLDRAIRGAMADLEGLRSIRGGAPSNRKAQKQTHFIEESRAFSPIFCDGIEDGSLSIINKDETDSASIGALSDGGKGPRTAVSREEENEKTKPLSSMFMGNRHERRRAQALAKRRART